MYSIKKVSEIIGIPPVTIRAWETRYNVVSPTRSEGGHRLYSEKDIEILKWLNNQTHHNNMKISDAVRQLKASHVNPVTIQNNQYDNLLKELYTSLVNLDNLEAHRIIEFAFSLFDYEEVIHELLVPTLYRIGDEWEKKKLTVAQEHFSSQLIVQRCIQLFKIFPINTHLPKALAFCPEGEDHHIGLLTFSLFLRKKGMDVIYLGANTPYEGLHGLIEKKNIEVISISLTNPKLCDDLYNWIEATITRFPFIKVVLGGNGVGNTGSYHEEYNTLLNKKQWEGWFTTKIM
ncbi:MerR family transcriptional regulator [Evansella sp. AB-P1]|uniref:MerR family transcriptional regulator n=1 Tax=Evansella sp. AB-P1 TaxID=3037653 RepID=UPI00241E675A|nr:MerR family transcriptional regulator [Evansella sp. AB-P1]MDG5789526.1 MerR family transcriptional regulator [Evansella sp. AB-P1]